MPGSAKTLLVSLSVLGLVATACGSSAKTSAGSTNTTAEAQMASHHMGDMGSFFLKAAEQHSDGKTVVVEEAVLTGTSGWVVINAQTAAGAMGDIIGESTLLPAGTHMSVTVSLMHPLKASATVVAVLHLEDNNNTTFDFPNGDQPAMVGGAVVDVPIQVNVP